MKEKYLSKYLGIKVLTSGLWKFVWTCVTYLSINCLLFTLMFKCVSFGLLIYIL